MARKANKDAKQRFGEYATSTAFHVRVSRAMIDEMFQLDAYVDDDRYGMPIENHITGTALWQRGFIQRPTDDSCSGNWILSKSGKLVCELLKEAGFVNRYGAYSSCK